AVAIGVDRRGDVDALVVDGLDDVGKFGGRAVAEVDGGGVSGGVGDLERAVGDAPPAVVVLQLRVLGDPLALKIRALNGGDAGGERAGQAEIRRSRRAGAAGVGDDE